MEDVFAIQDDITSAIVDNLKPMLMDQEEARLRKRQPVDLEAYNLYLRGLWFWNKQNVDGFEKAIEYFTQAIEKDAECALAYSGLAYTFAALPYYSPSPPRDAFQKAREVALKALEIDDTIGEAHTSLAIVKTIYDWDWEGAEKEHRRALELNSGLAAGHISYAFFLLCMDSLDEATKEIETALDLDPLSLFINRLAGEYLLHARQYDRAIEVMQKAIEMDPSLPVAHSNLGQVYFAMERFEEALAEFEKEKAFSKGWGTFNDAWIGGTLAMLGRVDESQKILRDLLERAKRESVPTFFLASVHFMLGETDRAFELLEKAYDERDPWMWALKVAQSHEFMRSDPRGKAILKKMGLDR
ncbi:MAG: tetratricopeptide repeat protein [Candidatus Abyssubacteria bacterium]|nr:tetratricopeptide repeat protein [Candidatus Abyssubacteria bacterium]